MRKVGVQSRSKWPEPLFTEPSPPSCSRTHFPIAVLVADGSRRPHAGLMAAASVSSQPDISARCVRARALELPERARGWLL